jgi:hypothetical protein|tara:strand:- start:846 stop:1313 length:468 start_codon:yes stop_codon:yes gene_type:complete
MICGWSCFIAIMFIVGNVVFTYLMDKSTYVKKYRGSLTENQQKIYDTIVNERKKLALQGYVLGIGLCIIFLLYQYFNTNNKKTMLNNACFTVAITFIVQYFYYILMPKQKWMLNNLSSEEQKNQWLNVYRIYSRNYHFSMLIGIVGAGLLGYSIC